MLYLLPETVIIGIYKMQSSLSPLLDVLRHSLPLDHIIVPCTEPVDIRKTNLPLLIFYASQLNRQSKLMLFLLQNCIGLLVFDLGQKFFLVVIRDSVVRFSPGRIVELSMEDEDLTMSVFDFGVEGDGFFF